MNRRSPYSIAKVVYRQLQGEGEVRYHDGEEFKFRTRINFRKERKVRLLSPVHEIPVCCPPRMRNLTDHLKYHYPLEQETVG